ncbi:MAG: hypothetical protein MJ125_00930 [Clostridia bacterium]|nr:hypothetical protein [Clostridia bacterium]
MAMDKKQQQNIITIAVVAVAVIFAILALLVKFKIIGPDANRNTTTTEPEMGSTVVEKSSVNDDGEVVFYTAIETYTLGDATPLHWYPNTTKETKPQTEVVTEHKAVTDAEGNPIYDENGEPATEVVSHTVQKTTASDSTQGSSSPQEDTTAADENGEPVTNPSTEAAAPSTEASAPQEKQED